MRLAAFASLLSARVHNAAGLRQLLSGLLGGVGVKVVEHIPRWVNIPVRPTMGRGGRQPLVLGASCTLGARLFDIAGKFRVVLGPLRYAAYQTFLPGGAQARLLNYLVRLYAPDHLDYDVELHLDTSDLPSVKLGSGQAQLGRTAWLGKPNVPFTVQHITYA
jgi:type VI secretion system protein ImpH